MPSSTLLGQNPLPFTLIWMQTKSSGWSALIPSSAEPSTALQSTTTAGLLDENGMKMGKIDRRMEEGRGTTILPWNRKKENKQQQRRQTWGPSMRWSTPKPWRKAPVSGSRRTAARARRWRGASPYYRNRRSLPPTSPPRTRPPARIWDMLSPSSFLFIDGWEGCHLKSRRPVVAGFFAASLLLPCVWDLANQPQRGHQEKGLGFIHQAPAVKWLR